MKLAIVRHAIAESKELYAKGKRPDSQRPLTARGRRRMRQNALGIASLFPEAKLIISSPYARATQTAEIISEAYKKVGLTSAIELAPSTSPEHTLTWLKRTAHKGDLLLVGHEPHLSRFIGFILTGQKYSFIAFKKGGLCILEFPGKIEKGRARLLCCAPPSLLRKAK